MKKYINGRLTDVGNIQLFELAEESNLIDNTNYNSINKELNNNHLEFINKIVSSYNDIYNKLAYPLYAIESDIKYATIATIMKDRIHNIFLWINNGLHIRLDMNIGLAIKFVKLTWSLEIDNNMHEDNSHLSLYNRDIAYREYIWMLDKILTDKDKCNYYERFMPGFISACKFDKAIIKWELENILKFGYIPNILDIKDNQIISIDSDEIYYIDLFYGNETRYEYISYIKKKDKDKKISKWTKIDDIGMRNVFNELCNVKSNNSLVEFPVFKGLIHSNLIIFTINKDLYITKKDKNTTSENIINDVKIINFENDKLFFIKNTLSDNNIWRNTIYSYDIKNKKLKLNRIFFTKENIADTV